MADTLIAQIPEAVRDTFSREVIHQAQPKTRFMQFAKRRNDLLQQTGGSIKFTKFNQIQKGGKLTEGTAIGEKAMGTSEVSITLEEFGNAVKVSEKALQLSMFDVLEEASQLLANDMAVVLDEGLRDSALSTTNIVYANGRTSGATLIAGDIFDTTIIKDAVEALNGNNAPKFDNEYYICIAHPHQLRQLRDDNDWIETHKYQGVEQIYKGEVGMYEGVRFVETTQMVANDIATSNANYGTVGIPTWEAVIFGENAYAWAVALDVEMRDNGVEDYGRKHGLAWYGIWGFGLIEEENIFKLLSA